MNEDKPFTNRELKMYFDGFETTLKNMEISFEKRVSPLETHVSKLLLWREGLMAKLSVAVFLIVLVVKTGLDWLSKHVGIN